MEKESVEIEIHEQKEGMTGVFIIKEPSCPKGKPDPCDYRPPPPQEELTKILQERNLILEQHARQLETDFNDYKDQTDRRIEKLAGLLKELIEEKNPPKLIKSKSIKQ